MAESTEIPAWIALFMGIYALGASIGEFRTPGFWKKMVADMAHSNALMFLAGIVVIALGATIYLVTPWLVGDWLAMLVKATGGLMVFEGFAILAFGGLFLDFAKRLMAFASRPWALLSGLIGLALIVVALLRLGTI